MRWVFPPIYQCLGGPSVLTVWGEGIAGRSPQRSAAQGPPAPEHPGERAAAASA